MSKLPFLGKSFRRVIDLARLARLQNLLIGSMLLSIIMAEAFALIPAMIYWRAQEVARLEEHVLSLLRANVDATTFPTVVDTVRAGERLMSFSPIRGGVVVNMFGDELGSFGNPPRLTWREAQRDGPIKISDGGRYIDIFYPQYRTGLAFPTMIRIDGDVVSNAISKRQQDTFFVVLGVALISSLVLGAIIGVLMIRPIVRLRDAAKAAVELPEQADSFRLRWARHDELGDAARALDTLLASVSLLHHDDVAAGQDAILKNPHAILTYDVNGKLLNANPAALTLFGAASIGDLALSQQSFLQERPDGVRKELSAIEVIRSRSDDKIFTIMTKNRPVQCHVSALSIQKRRGNGILYHFLTLVDVSKYVQVLHGLQEETRALTKARDLLRGRLAEQKRLFESCAIIMSNLQVQEARLAEEESKMERIALEDLLDAWCTDALGDGLISGRIANNALPEIIANRSLVDTVFRQAFLTAYTQSPWEKPIIGAAVHTPAQSGDLIFDIHCKPLPDGAAQPAGDERKAAAPIALLSLQRALARLGGRIIPRGPDDGMISFVLPAQRREARGELAS